MPGLGELRVFIRRYAGARKWGALPATDLRMTYVKAIEIGFKETKQLLGLGKCRARDLDSQLAHLSTVKKLLDSEMFEVFKKVLLGTLTDYQQSWNPSQMLDCDAAKANAA